MPYLSQSVKNYFDSFFRILVNVLKWEAIFVELKGISSFYNKFRGRRLWGNGSINILFDKLLFHTSIRNDAG